jgi:hypothetical protein
MENQNQLQTIQQNAPVTFNFFDKDQFAIMQRVCQVFINSELVPKMYRISQDNPEAKAVANCMIAVEMAQRIGASPLMVMQNMYIVHGSPSWSSKFLIATVNGCGKFHSLKYRITKLPSFNNNGVETENFECVAYTSEKGSNDILESSPVSIEMAFREGWLNKNGSKWKTMPLKMLRYRAASFWTNEYAPELSMGIKTAEEVEDAEYEDMSIKVQSEIQNNANREKISFDDLPEKKYDATMIVTPAYNNAPGDEPIPDAFK